MYDPHDEFRKEDHIPGEAPVEVQLVAAAE